MRYELRRHRYKIFFDILLPEGCKNNFSLLGRSEEHEIWCRYEISFDILLLGGVKIIFYYWEGVRSVRYELRRYKYEISWYFITRKV